MAAGRRRWLHVDGLWQTFLLPQKLDHLCKKDWFKRAALTKRLFSSFFFTDPLILLAADARTKQTVNNEVGRLLRARLLRAALTLQAALRILYSSPSGNVNTFFFPLTICSVPLYSFFSLPERFVATSPVSYEQLLRLPPETLSDG